MRSFGLLSCAAAIVHLTRGAHRIEPDQLFDVIAKGKKAAKQMETAISLDIVDRSAEEDR